MACAICNSHAADAERFASDCETTPVTNVDQIKACALVGQTLRDFASALRSSCRHSPSEASEDSARLDFIIDAGPPGASNREWLSEEAWEAATSEVDHTNAEASTDRQCMRAAIDAARGR